MTYFPLSTPDKDINKSLAGACDAFDEGAGEDKRARRILDIGDSNNYARFNADKIIAIFALSQ